MLKPKEKKLAELMCCEPSLRNVDYAGKVGISEKSVYVYKAKPEFQEYLSQLCKERFRAMEALAVKKLNEEVSKNNFRAIQYVLDSLNYNVEKQEIKMEAKIEVDYGED